MSSFSSYESANVDDMNSICWVTITTTNTVTGQSTVTTYYSTSRTSLADCEAGAAALAAGNFMMSSDFKRSPVVAPDED